MIAKVSLIVGVILYDIWNQIKSDQRMYANSKHIRV